MAYSARFPHELIARMGRKSRPGSNHQGQFDNHKGGTTSFPVAVVVSRSASNEAQRIEKKKKRVKSQQNCQRPGQATKQAFKENKVLTAGGRALPGITCGPGIGDVLVKILR